MSLNWNEKANKAHARRGQQQEAARVAVEQEVASLQLEAFLKAVRDSQLEFQIPSWMQAKNELSTTLPVQEGSLAAKAYRLQRNYALHVTGPEVFITIAMFAVLRNGEICLQGRVTCTQDFLSSPLEAVQALSQRYPGIDIDVEMHSRLTAVITIKLKEGIAQIEELLEDLFLKRIY